jgi:hypothetical protein
MLESRSTRPRASNNLNHNIFLYNPCSIRVQSVANPGLSPLTSPHSIPSSPVAVRGRRSVARRSHARMLRGQRPPIPLDHNACNSVYELHEYFEPRMTHRLNTDGMRREMNRGDE